MKLREWIDKNCDGNVASFARLAEIPERTARRAAAGEPVATSTASWIVWATDGEVYYRDLVGDAELAPDPWERE